MDVYPPKSGSCVGDPKVRLEDRRDSRVTFTPGNPCTYEVDGLVTL